jgi:hypothetical protein
MVVHDAITEAEKIAEVLARLGDRLHGAAYKAAGRPHRRALTFSWHLSVWITTAKRLGIRGG